jgi:hypothetical protein
MIRLTFTNLTHSAMRVRVEQFVELVVDGGRHGCGVGDPREN